jgi:hypothetical protein
MGLSACRIEKKEIHMPLPYLTNARAARPVHVLILTTLGALSIPALADFNFDDFNNPQNPNLVGNAGFSGGALRITAATEGQLGAAWYDQKQPIAGGFETTFRFNLSGAGGVEDFWGMFGADGLAFVIQNADPFAVGEGGSGMGYGGIANSLAVEFDTWGHPFFEDPDSNHISVQSLGTEPNSYTAIASLGLTSAIAELSDGATHTARIAYDGAILSVEFDNSVVLEVSVDLSTLLGLDGGAAFVGFTASTGGAWQNHDVLSWSFAAGACYADFTGDGLLDLFDFLAYVNAFNAGDIDAECDGDEGLTLFDFLCFVNAFNAGC